MPSGGRVVPVDVNASGGLAVLDADGAVSAVISLSTWGGRVSRVDLVLSPAKLPRRDVARQWAGNVKDSARKHE